MDAAHLESALANHRYFGRADYLADRVLDLYRQRLGRLAPAFGALRLVEHLARLPQLARFEFVRDPTFRAATDQALLSTRGESTHLSDARIEALIREACEGTPEATAPLLARTSALRLQPHGLVIWDAERVETTAEQAAAQLFSTLLPLLTFCRVTPSELATLERGAQLLERMLPTLTPSVLRHVGLIAVAESAATPRPGDGGEPRFFRSATLAALPGTILLSRSVLESPWTAAAALLHEALHLKFIDLEYTHTIGSAAERAGAIAPITPPWHAAVTGPDAWPIKRAMTALHVYVGLSLFYWKSFEPDAVFEELAGEPRPAQIASQLQCAIDRARYLSSQLEPRATALGAAGRQFVKWLSSLVDSLEPQAVRAEG